MSGFISFYKSILIKKINKHKQWVRDQRIDYSKIIGKISIYWVKFWNEILRKSYSKVKYLSKLLWPLSGNNTEMHRLKISVTFRYFSQLVINNQNTVYYFHWLFGIPELSNHFNYNLTSPMSTDKKRSIFFNTPQTTLK